MFQIYTILECAKRMLIHIFILTKTFRNLIITHNFKYQFNNFLLQFSFENVKLQSIHNQYVRHIISQFKCQIFTKCYIILLQMLQQTLNIATIPIVRNTQYHGCENSIVSVNIKNSSLILNMQVIVICNQFFRISPYV